MRIFIAIITAAHLSFFSSASAAEGEFDTKEIPKIIEKCDVSGSGGDLVYRSCFNIPQESFYGRAYVYFSVENTDLNELIAKSGKKQSFLNALKSILISNKDSAHFVLRATSTSSNGQKAGVGTYPLLTVIRDGSKEYRLKQTVLGSSLPARFLADDSSRIDFEIGVLVERKSESKIAQLLHKAASLSGIALPKLGQTGLSPEQKLFKEVDAEISQLLSFKSEFGVLAPIVFGTTDLNNMQAYETSIALNKFLPEQAKPRLIVMAYPQESVFKTAPLSEVNARQNLTRPGGKLTSSILGTQLRGQTVAAHLISALGADDYNHIRYSNSANEYAEACQKLQTILDTNQLSLTAHDNIRVEWAVMSGNPILSKPEVRTRSCVSMLENKWATLGLGSPQVEPVRLSNDYWLILDKAQSEKETALETVASAVAARDQARSNADAAHRGGNVGYAISALNAYLSYAGEALQSEKTVTGIVTEKSALRMGNLYEGQFVWVNSKALYQGFGQYTSQSADDDIGYKEYVGQFEGDYGTGHGKIVYHDGGIYTGETSREKPNGYGELSYINGKTLYAKFVDGKPSGKAVQVDSDGRRSAGEILADGRFRPNIN